MADFNKYPRGTCSSGPKSRAGPTIKLPQTGEHEYPAGTSTILRIRAELRSMAAQLVHPTKPGKVSVLGHPSIEIPPGTPASFAATGRYEPSTMPRRKRIV
jgi:hypothetical protein